MNGEAFTGIDWDKQNGLLPAVVQDSRTARVLMLAYMNEEALSKTLDTGQVHFFSRSRQRLWRKGETSGNVLTFKSVAQDCDGDTLLVQAEPAGPVCHTGRQNCFGAAGPRPGPKPGPKPGPGFLSALEQTIAERGAARSGESYTAQLLAQGVPRIARKVGEEAVEVALAAVTEDDPAFIGEAADLIYHLIVLLHSRDLSLRDVEDCLEARHLRRALRPQPG